MIDTGQGKHTVCSIVLSHSTFIDLPRFGAEAKSNIMKWNFNISEPIVEPIWIFRGW